MGYAIRYMGVDNSVNILIIQQTFSPVPQVHIGVRPALEVPAGDRAGAPVACSLPDSPASAIQTGLLARLGCRCDCVKLTCDMTYLSDFNMETQLNDRKLHFFTYLSQISDRPYTYVFSRL